MTLTGLKNPQRPLGHVLHIGAGAGGDLPAYQDWGVQRITLVEPDFENLAALQDARHGDARINVIAAAVTTQTEPCKLHRFAFSDLNSLRRPTGLWELFPGLETISQDIVTLCDPVVLVDQLKLDDSETHMLVIEAPGEALDILAKLDQTDRLTRFSVVRVQEGLSHLYEHAGTFEQVRALLEAAGFCKDVQIDDSDPERPILMARFDRAGSLQKELQEELNHHQQRFSEAQAKAAHLEAECAKAQDRLSYTRSELQSVQATLAERDTALQSVQATLAERDTALQSVQATLAERDTALQSVQATLAERDTALQSLQATLAERDTALQSLQATLAERDTALQSLQATLAERDTALQSLQATLAERDTALQSLQATLAERDTALQSLQAAKAKLVEQHATQEAELGKRAELLQAEKSKLETHMSELKSRHGEDIEALRGEKAAMEDLNARQRGEIETLRKDATQAEDRSVQMASDLRLALRTQALAQADLSDLQTRFTKLGAEKDMQDALLLKVTQRLTAASARLQELSQPSEADQKAVSQKAPRKRKAKKTSAAVRTVKGSVK